jgi:hypothetical protein
MKTMNAAQRDLAERIVAAFTAGGYGVTGNGYAFDRRMNAVGGKPSAMLALRCELERADREVMLARLRTEMRARGLHVQTMGRFDLLVSVADAPAVAA